MCGTAATPSSTTSGSCQVHRRPLIVVGLALVCVLGVAFFPTWFAVPAGLLLVGVLPGFALTDALFGLGGDLAERVLTIVGLSLSTVVLSGLLLDVTAGITRTSFAVLLAAVTIAAAATSAGLSRRTATRSARPRVRVSLPEVLAVAVAVVLTAGAVAYARKPLHARGITGYSILWIHPAAKVVATLTPSGDITARASHKAEVAVVSQELRTTQYLVVASTGSGPTRKWQLTLRPGARWHAFVAEPLRGDLRAVLYVRGDKGWRPYRNVRLVV